MTGVKDRENTHTLMHFLVEHCERHHPELLSFADELIHLDSASKVSVDDIMKVLKQIEKSTKDLERDLETAAKTKALDPDDR